MLLKVGRLTRKMRSRAFQDRRSLNPEVALSAAMDLASETPAIIEFGHFRVLPRRRELLANGRPIHLGGRTFDVLLALIEGQRAVLTQDPLMNRLCPARTLEQ